MALFDVSKYEIPKINEIEFEKTKYNVGMFLYAYKAARGNAGQPQIPKTTASFSIVPPSFTNEFHSTTENAALFNIEAREEFINLHQLFNKGYTAIEHPFKSDVSQRRKRIFMLRYMQGLPVDNVVEIMGYEKDVINEEAKKSLLQFANALDLIEKTDI